MTRKSTGIFLASAMLLAGASVSVALAPSFKVSDQVEALTYYIGSDTRAGEPTPVATPPAINKPRPVDDSAPTTRTAPRTRNSGEIKVGDRVDVLSMDYTPPEPKGRGTVIEVGDGKYKISYEGCASYHDDWQDRRAVQPEATISAADAEITFLIGSWAMFSPSYPNTVVRGNTVYREYGLGAKAPPLQIKADGSYVWYFDFGKAPVKGTWTTSAIVGERKLPGAQSRGTSPLLTNTGVIIQDPKGEKWKVYRWTMPGSEDRITAHLMCSGESIVGSRIK